MLATSSGVCSQARRELNQSTDPCLSSSDLLIFLSNSSRSVDTFSNAYLSRWGYTIDSGDFRIHNLSLQVGIISCLASINERHQVPFNDLLSVLVVVLSPLPLMYTCILAVRDDLSCTTKHRLWTKSMLAQ